MFIKRFISRWDNKTMLRLRPASLLVASLLVLVVSGLWTVDSLAQDEGPICPPGFEWRRMSGVGCVQEDCTSVGGRLTYTSACICNDGQRECSEPVDYANFDVDNCGIHCPGYRLLACVAPEEACPSEVIPEDPPDEPSMDWEVNGNDARERIEHFVIGGHAEAPTPGRAAAAAAVGTLSLGIWSVLQWLGEREPTGVKKGLASLEQSASKQGAEVPGSGELRETAAGLVTDAADVIDKMPKRKPKLSDDATVLRRLSEPSANQGTAVFYGEEARLILAVMGKLPPGITQNDTLLLDQGDFSSLTGGHADGRPRSIRLPSGREIIVSAIEAVGYEDQQGIAGGPIEITFNEKLVLTAILGGELSDDLHDAPTISREDALNGLRDDEGEGEK